jgi:hypothetical protein
MTVEFKFEDTIYKYEYGKLYYKDRWNCFVYFCPVLIDLQEILNTFTNNECITILEAIIHSSLYDYNDGKKAKIQEFKNVFNLD